MREMEPLLKKKVEKMAEGKLLKIGFSKDGNGHLYSDALSRSKVLKVEDLKDLDKVLEKSIYVDKRKKNESHKNPYEEFYYFESELHQQKIRINVGKLTKRKKNGQISVRYICYSINDIK